MSESKSPWGEETKFFHTLTPDHVMQACELFGQRLSGRVMALNSLENRVYDVELAKAYDFDKGFSQQHLIVKFYRPGRWSMAQILEEHRFLLSLKEFEVPVVAPIEINGQTLHHHSETQLYFALFPKVQGRLKDELNKEEIEQVGRLIGRIHNIGTQSNFKERITLGPNSFIESSRLQLQTLKPVEHLSFNHYLTLLEQAYRLLTPMFTHLQTQRLHGDFHRGNIVWTSGGPIAVDFDDCLTGPVEQDLWLLFPGQDPESLQERERFLGAYSEMTRREHLHMQLTEALRLMRMVHFNAWIAKRWQDQSFQRMFPQFLSASYWDQQLIDLRVQLGLLQENSQYH
jgi:Ser/Thr protein kinase RdoA (MazF antagonist)